MADDAQGTAAPATTETTTAAPEKPRVQANELPPEALKSRLDSAKETGRREILAELGAADPKDVKAALAELKKRQDAERSEVERLTARAKELEDKATLADSLSVVVASRAAAEMGALNEKARAFVTAEAGADPAKQLATIDRLRSTGLLDTPPAAPATPAAPVAPAAPRSTSPAPTAPADAGTAAITDHRAEHARLKQINPFAAAAYGLRHAADVFVPKP